MCIVQWSGQMCMAQTLLSPQQFQVVKFFSSTSTWIVQNWPDNANTHLLLSANTSFKYHKFLVIQALFANVQRGRGRKCWTAWVSTFHFRGVPLYINWSNKCIHFDLSTSVSKLKLTHVDSEVNQYSCVVNHLWDYCLAVIFDGTTCKTQLST